MAEPSEISMEDLGIPREFVRYADVAAPAPVKMMAARGLVPAPPRVMLSILFKLTTDPDEAVASAAEKGLTDLPGRMLEGAIDDTTHPAILDWLALNREGDARVEELILLRRQVSDDTLAYLAERVDERLLGIVAGNQERLLKSPSLYFSIARNPAATAGVTDRILSFLQMNGITPREDEDHVDTDPGEEVFFPPELVEESKSDPTARIEALLAAPHVEAEVKGQEKTLWAAISEMSIAHKIKLALLGNGMARSILIRDTNKMVATAVMKSPRLTDPEILAIAKNRNVCEDVLRMLGKKKEWTKKYPVRVALANNPKTPTAIALTMAATLSLNDLKQLAKNRNVPSVVSKRAREMMKSRAK